MSCGGDVSLFRLLDPIVGWDVAKADGLAGLAGADAVTLALSGPGGVGGDALAPFLPPPWLAPGCGPCAWWLATPAASGLTSRLLRLDACGCDWVDVWRPGCSPLEGLDIAAIAAEGDRIAIAGRDGTLLLVEAGGEWVAASLMCHGVTTLAFGPHGVLVVARSGADRLARFDRGGGMLAPFGAVLPVPAAQVRRLAATADGAVWLATAGTPAGTFSLWSAGAADAAFSPATPTQLAAAARRTLLAAAGDDGFCVFRPAADGSVATCCYSRYGRPVAAIAPAAVPQYQRTGELLTAAIDSGIPRCTWHRVRLDADIPTGTLLSLAVASTDAVDAVPHPLDWQQSSFGDFLIQQPPGRYLFVRLSLQSLDGTATPAVRRVRLDFLRASSIDLLPAIYRDDADAADFTARFLSLFDASIADLDEAIAHAPALLDAGGVPDDVLPWLGSFVGLVFDPAWDAARRQAILQKVPELYRLRGTLAGLKLAFKLVFDVEPAVEELGPTRPWAGLSQGAQLGGFRLFGRNRSRATIGRSALGQTVLKSWGDPARDPLDVLANRVRVSLPPSFPPRDPARVTALLDSQKPAHVLASLRTGGRGFVVGSQAAVGIDTGFLPPPAPVLGTAGSIRLGRASILYRRRPAPPSGFRVGRQPLTE